MTTKEFLPPRVPLVTTPFDTSAATPDQVLREYVDAVRAWRGSRRRATLSFRVDDVAALSLALGTDPDEIERRLIAITGCTPVEARLLRKWFLAALVTLPVAAAALGAVAPTAAAATGTPSRSSASAGSATTLVQAAVRPGALSLTVANPTLGVARADGSVPLTAGYVITDARGSGAGWTVQAAFTSTDAEAYPTLETLRNVSGETGPQPSSALPDSLTSTPAVIAHAASGSEGMGSFAGRLEVSVVGQPADSSGELTLTLAPPASG